MSITFNLYYKGKNNNALLFAKEMEESGIADKIRSSKGNLKYEYFVPLNSSDTVLLIDSWQDEAALRRTGCFFLYYSSYQNKKDTVKVSFLKLSLKNIKLILYSFTSAKAFFIHGKAVMKYSPDRLIRYNVQSTLMIYHPLRNG